MNATAKTSNKADSAISKAKAANEQVDAYIETLRAKGGPWRTVPGFGAYEWNGKILRNRATLKTQAIPSGKKKYLIYNDKNERRSIGVEEIKTALPAPAASNGTSKAKAPREKKEKDGPSKKEQIMSLHKEGLTVKEIEAKTGISYNTVYITIKVATIMGLHEKGKSVKEIAEKTGYSEDSIKWQISK